jgi:O-antigen/teichoic acid export membrane protein
VVIVALVIVAIAPYAATYFREPRVVPVMLALACVTLVSGFQSIGLVLIRRELDFAKDFRFTLYTRIIGFVTTVTLALATRSYWAIVVAQAVSTLAGVLISYRMHPYRASLSLKVAGEYLRFGAHVLPTQVGVYLIQKLGTLVVGRVASTAAFGNFNVVAELTTIIVGEVAAPVGRALLPSYAKVAGKPEQLAESYLDMLGFMALICIPLGAGLAAVSHDFVLLLLGEQWLASVPLLPWLAVFASLRTLSFLFKGQIMIVTGNERLALVATWIELAVFAPLLLLGAKMNGVDGAVRAMSAAAFITLPITGYILTRAISVTMAQILAALLRPAAAASIMVLVLWVVDTGSMSLAVVRMTADVAIGASAYIGSLLALWWFMGRPSGPEQLMTSYIATKVR